MAPVFSNKSQTSDFTASNATKTTLATTAVGDLVVVGLVGENLGTVYGTPSGNSLTYTAAVARNVSNRGNAALYVSSLDAVGATGWSVSDTVTTTLSNWGLGAVVFSGCAASAIGATNVADFNTAGSLGQISLTTTADHSAVIWLMADWQAADHSTRVYQTINGFTPVVGGTGEVFGVRTIGQYSGYMAYWPDAGLAGAKTLGTTTEAYNGGMVMCALEIKAGVAGGPAKTAPKIRTIGVQSLAAALRAANW